MARDRHRVLVKFGASGTAIALLIAMSVFAFAPHDAGADTPPPVAELFYMSALSVSPGSQVALLWHARPNESYLLTSIAPTTLPGFSGSAVRWPANAQAAWDGSWHWWTTRSTAVGVSIPQNATDGTTYRFQLSTCTAAFTACSNSPRAKGRPEVTLTVTTGWQTVPYSADFFKHKIFEPAGAPLDVAFSADGTIWNSSEGSSGISETKGPSLNATYYPDPVDVFSPFAHCSPSCEPTSLSQLAERIVVANGSIWSTLGGWQFDIDRAVPNISEILAFNPASQTYCTYIVPGNDNEVIGLAVTGSHAQTRIWFIESSVMTGKPSLDWFNPSSVGDGCPGTNDDVFSLDGSLHKIPWPASNLPAQIAVDDSTSDLWVTDSFGSEVDRVDANTGELTRYHLPTRNKYSWIGSFPWQLAADAGYVYVISYEDSTLVRINKADDHMDVVPLPLASDVEQAYGLALSGGKLYFTLSDDGQPSFGAASTFGYISISAWEAASASCPPGTDCAPSPPTAVIYSGIGTSHSDFRGIAVGPGGVVAIADLGGIIRMVQRRP